MQEYSIIGKNMPRKDAVEKVMGEAKFTDDIVLPRTLCGKILRSPYPHARILNIDTGKAEKLLGVKGVITGKDTMGIKFGILDTPEIPADQYPLAMDKVRYIGDEVAAVAAIDEDTAEEALDLIEVEYEELLPVFDPVGAMREDAPKIHDVESNLGSKIFWDFGDVEKGFNESDYIREDEFRTNAVSHSPMEPHTALAHFDPSGKLTLWASKQSPFLCHLLLAKTLGLSENQVRVIAPHVGGGFGGKVDLLATDFCSALLSKNTGRPVRISCTREEVFTSTRQRHPMIVYIKTGVKKDGTLVAKYCKNISDTGAYNSTGPVALYLSGAFLVATYRIPNVRYEGYSVYTNKSVRGAMRGHGCVQIRFADDSQMDMIAEDLGLDPIEIRVKNSLHPGDVLPNEFKVTSCGINECIKRASESIDWNKRRDRKSVEIGLGVGCGSFISGFFVPPHTSAAAMVKLQEDGGVTLITGATDIGQGSSTVLSQIAAEELGVPFDTVRVISADTEITPHDPGSFSSRVTFLAGNAVKIAVQEAKKQVFEVAAEILEANIKDLEAKEGKIYVKGSPKKNVSFHRTVMTSLLKSGNPIMGRGYYRPPNTNFPDLKTGKGNPTGAYSFSAHIAEVAIDRETGFIKMPKFVVAHDCGRALNPQQVTGQLEGSVNMGQAQALSEDIKMEGGQVLNPSFLSYGIPLSLSIPKINVISVETVDQEGPFGAKEAGEGNLVPTPAAIANAVYDAIGVRIKELPITPEKILKALEEKKGE
ncbi:MAG: xanthine dehydrogenase family protein molybdopterin-binding subunit [Thermodesulfobacteriota bacterium]|nr:xanthine dehydrogenase family protein molybdopterin-binding subunit [Thermodesulfobacteriota bacterium]